MNTIDIVILIPLLLGFVFGLSKGFIREIISLAVIFVGIYGSKLFSPIVSSMLTGVFSVSETVAKPLSFVVIFIAIALLMMFLARSLDKLVESIALGGINKFFGGVFGALKYALIISLLLNIFHIADSKIGFLNAQTKTDSILYKPMLQFAPQLWEEVKEIKTEKEN
jgi:membrane protein required for colicin V production